MFPPVRDRQSPLPPDSIKAIPFDSRFSSDSNGTSISAFQGISPEIDVIHPRLSQSLVRSPNEFNGLQRPQK